MKYYPAGRSVCIRNPSASSSRDLLTAPPYRGSRQRPSPRTFITRATQKWYMMPYKPAPRPLSGLFNPEQAAPGSGAVVVAVR